jgi:hypothetical protein
VLTDEDISKSIWASILQKLESQEEFWKKFEDALMKNTKVFESGMRNVLTDAGISKSILESIFSKFPRESQKDFQKKFKDELLANTELFEKCMRIVLSDSNASVSIWNFALQKLASLDYVSRKDLNEELREVRSGIYQLAIANPIMQEKFRNLLRNE